jgi:DNA-binding XRE family transcriptional regulator
MPTSPPTRPRREPLQYVVGGWPHGEVRSLDEDEGGEPVRYQLDQLRLFVAEVVHRREERGVTQAKLAELTGLRRNTISELEAGRSYPDWTTISRLAYALEADVRFVGRRSHRVDPAGTRL